MGAPSEAIRDRQGKWLCCPSTTAVLGIRRRRCRRVVCGSLRCWDPKESRISTTTHEKWPFLAPCRVLGRLVRQIGSNLLIGNPARPVPGFFVGPKTRQNNPICPLPLLLPLPVILVGCARWEVGKCQGGNPSVFQARALRELAPAGHGFNSHLPRITRAKVL